MAYLSPEDGSHESQALPLEPDGILSDIVTPTYKQPDWYSRTTYTQQAQINMPRSFVSTNEPSNEALLARATLASEPIGTESENSKRLRHLRGQYTPEEKEAMEFESNRDRIVYSAHGILYNQRCILKPRNYNGDTVLSTTGEDENGAYQLAYYSLHDLKHEIILTIDRRKQQEKHEILLFKSGFETDSIVPNAKPFTPENAAEIVRILQDVTFTNPRLNALSVTIR